MKLYTKNDQLHIGDLYSSLLTTRGCVQLAKVADECERSLRLDGYKCSEWSDGTCAQVFAGLIKSGTQDDGLLLLLMCMQGRHVLATLVVSYYFEECICVPPQRRSDYAVAQKYIG